MKTKIFLLVCLFTGVLATQLSAQKGKGVGIKPDVYDWPVNPGELKFEIICDGKVIDEVVNIELFYQKCVEHLNANADIIAWNNSMNNALFQSTHTGELFKYDGYTRGKIDKLCYIHDNLIGKNGSHYIGHTILNSEDWSVVESEFRCH